MIIRHLLRVVPCLICLVAGGCGRQVPPAVRAATAPATPVVKPLAIQSVSHREEPLPSETPGNRAVTWEVQIAEIPDDRVESLGLTEFFASAEPANALMQEAIEQNEAMQTARAFTNLTLQLPSHSVAVGTCTEETVQTLVGTLQTMMGVDLLSLAKVRGQMSRESDVSVQDIQTVVMGTTSAGQALTTNLASGVVTRLRAAGEGDRLEVEVKSTLTLFHGYKTPVQATPEPIVEVRAMGARTELKHGEVLLLGSPVLEKRQIYVDRVPYLGAIPLLGEKLFTKREVQTNSVRNLLIIRVKE